MERSHQFIELTRSDTSSKILIQLSSISAVDFNVLSSSAMVQIVLTNGALVPVQEDYGYIADAIEEVGSVKKLR